MSRLATCHPEKKHVAHGLCWACYLKKRRTSNPGSRKEENKSYYWRNKERECARAWAWKKENPDRVKESNRIWETKNHDLRNDQMRERRLIPRHRLENNMRRRLHKALRNGKSVVSAVKDLGCSMSCFKLYIENQFLPGMTWSNYGKWHLDHVIPVSHFDLTDRMQTLEAFNWLNYQPLWAIDNLKKNNRLGET